MTNITDNPAWGKDEHGTNPVDIWWRKTLLDLKRMKNDRSVPIREFNSKADDMLEFSRTWITSPLAEMLEARCPGAGLLIHNSTRFEYLLIKHGYQLWSMHDTIAEKVEAVFMNGNTLSIFKAPMRKRLEDKTIDGLIDEAIDTLDSMYRHDSTELCINLNRRIAKEAFIQKLSASSADTPSKKFRTRLLNLAEDTTYTVEFRNRVCRMAGFRLSM